MENFGFLDFWLIFVDFEFWSASINVVEHGKRRFAALIRTLSANINKNTLKTIPGFDLLQVLFSSN